MTLTAPAITAAADRLLNALDEKRQITPLTRGEGGLAMSDAYRISRAVTARRVARGERIVGRKIGFTNRTIWQEYGVSQPIDGPMYAGTVVRCAGPVSGISVSRFVEPRIEPEIVLGLATAPVAGMDERELMSCIGWMAHGFEIVQSLFPGWSFGGADCVAAFGLHGALYFGPPVAIAADQRVETLQALENFEIALSRDGVEIDRGQAANVLGGPVSALRYLAASISDDPEAAPLAAGDIITTGTVTRAFPIAAGERWTTVVEGLPLPGMDLSLVA